MLVFHYTGMETGQAAIDRMCDPAAEVSAHYMVWEDGRVSQLVAEDKRAWHAGVSIWRGDSDLNSRSIGIEIVNGGHDWPLPNGLLQPYPDVQIAAVIDLGKSIMTRWSIPQTRVVAHSDIAPTRKPDPGEHFPWQRLAEAGIGLWPLDAAGMTEGKVDPANALTQIGYDASDIGAAILAFQRRWFPHHLSGRADGETKTRITTVAQLYASA